MRDLLNIGLLPVALTLFSYQTGVWCQKKLRTPLANPILIAVVIVLAVLGLTGMDNSTYQAGAKHLSWLMTPATICLAIPMYQQFSMLRNNWKAILIGVASGAISCLVMVLLLCLVFGFSQELTISLLPKSVTSAIGVPLSELYGGLGAITTPAIILTGIIAASLSSPLCRLFRLRDPIAQGVALGTSGHVIGTSRANELDSLTGAVSSLSLVTAGLLTSVLFPLVESLV